MNAKQFHGSLARQWEAKYENRVSFRHREAILDDMLRRSCRQGDRWLDAGCGTGRFARHLLEFGAQEVMGVDASEEMLKVAETLSSQKGLSERIRFCRSENLADSGAGGDSIDGILCASVLEYLENPLDVLAEFHRILKPGRLLVVSVPNRVALLRIAQSLCYRITSTLGLRAWPGYLGLVRHQYVLSEISRELQDAGFELVEKKYGGSGLFASNLDRFRFWEPLLFLVARKSARKRLLKTGEPDSQARKPETPRLSVVFITLNEVHHLQGAIDSLGGLPVKVFVVDSGSTDGTVDLALKAGATVVQKEFKSFGSQWNFALNHLPIDTPWTMKLDPDERLTPELREEIRPIIEKDDAPFDGCEMPRRIWFMGKALHVRQNILRLWKTGSCQFSDVLVNEHPLVKGRIVLLKHWIEHLDSPNLHHWTEKQNRYSTMEAIMAVRGDPLAAMPHILGTQLERRMLLKRLFFRIPFRYQLLWLGLMFVQGAWRDGKIGAIWAHLRIELYRTREFKVLEMRMSGKMPSLSQKRTDVRFDSRVPFYETPAPSASPPGKPAPAILILVRYFIPAYKAGGPIQSLYALVRRVNGLFRFKVITRDRDSGDTQPLSSIKRGEWMAVPGAEVRYLANEELSFWQVIRAVRGATYDLLYLNSFFDPVFTLAPLLARRMGLLPDKPVVMAPRGELSFGGLAQKSRRKKVFLAVTRLLGLYRDVWWQASCETERKEILDLFRKDRNIGDRVLLARNLAVEPGPVDPSQRRQPKQPGHLRAVFISRISPKKNLSLAIELLRQVRGTVTLEIFGNISDPAYWSFCQSLAARAPALRLDYRGTIPHEEVVGRLRMYDLFVFPTQGENFGHVILESLLAGCPVAASSVTPWQDLETDRAGWVIPLTQEKRFVEVLQKVADMDESEHAVWREGACRRGQAVLYDPRPVEDSVHLFETALKEASGGLHAG